MVIVNSSSDAFISTGSLDGEKNLKPKFMIKELKSYFENGKNGQGL